VEGKLMLNKRLELIEVPVVSTIDLPT